MILSLYLPKASVISGRKIELPYSKSVLNRYLILVALAGQKIALQGDLLSDDTTLLLELLSTDDRKEYYCHNAGTVVRFLTAFLSLKPGVQVLDGSSRMRQRPIGPLVDALRSIGADITYAEEEGFLPLRIGNPPKKAHRHIIRMDAGTSSQFYTALLLVAPHWPGGIRLEVPEDMVSVSYLEMTLKVLKQSGIRYTRTGQIVQVPRQSIGQVTLPAVRDWSSAAFFFVLLALSEGGNMFFPGLQMDHIQGDQYIVEVVRSWGISTRQTGEGLWIEKTHLSLPAKCTIDLKSVPDLMPALAVLAAGTGVEVTFTGIGHLRYKESDRIEAMSTELAKGGVRFDIGEEQLTMKGTFDGGGTAVFQTWKDHRVAMSLACLCLKESIRIEHSEVVSKSFPGFWSQMQGVLE